MLRAVEDLVRSGGVDLRVVPPAPEEPPEERAEEKAEKKGDTSSATEGGTRRPSMKKLPEPGVLELEDLLSTHLNTRVKVDIQNRRGRLVVEFATLEDLERIYRAMVGDGGVA